MKSHDEAPGAGGTEGDDQEATGSVPSLPPTPDNSGPEVFDNLLDAGLHLIELGLPIVPVGKGKDPKGVIQWRHGPGGDYVTERMTADEWCTWATKPNVHGIAVLGSNVYGTSILDIEKPGVDEPMILAARQMLPETCQVDTFSGGWHGYCVVDGEHPGGRIKLAQHPPLEGATDPLLLAERRGHGSYAVIVGPGRPPLRRDFAPARLTREQYDQIEDMIRQAGTYIPQEPPVREYNRTGKGGGTGDIVSEALRQGALSPLAVLPDGWEIVGHDKDRTYIKRPGGTSETSGNVKDGVVAIHSTAVDWAPTPPEGKSAKPISGAECLARARFDGDFYAAMRWVEQAAAALIDDGERPEHWPAEVLEAVHDLNMLGATPRPAAAAGAEGGEDRPADLSRGRLSTVPMGRRFARERLAGDYLYVTEMGWHQWDGLRWARVTDDAVMAVAADWAEAFIIDLIRSGAEDSAVKEALKYRNVGMVRQLLAGARTEANILKDAEQMDDHPGLLPCANGVVDLRTGHLQPLTPDLFNTKNTEVDYVPDARHDDWDAALRAIPDEKTRTWVQTSMGAAASGETDRSGPVQFHQGDGLNGKTTVIGAIVTAFGDFAVLVPDKLLTGHGNEHDTLWMPLRGARLAYLEELPEDHTLPVARIKKLADTPILSGRLIGRDYVTWRATHSLVISTNYWPRVTETDHGTWRRLAMVTYPLRFAGNDRDVSLKKRLKTGKAQRQAVLAWIVAGAKRWYAEGQDVDVLPAAVKASTAEWQDMGDALGEYLRHSLTPTGNPDDRLTTKELLSHFNDTLPTGTRPWSPALFGTRLRSHMWVAQHGLSVDRGPRNRLPVGLSGVVWVTSAQGAQGQVGGFSGERQLKSADTTLRTLRAPTNPVSEQQEDAAVRPRCSVCSTAMFMKPGEDLCANCRRDAYRRSTQPKEDTA